MTTRNTNVYTFGQAYRHVPIVMRNACACAAAGWQQAVY